MRPRQAQCAHEHLREKPAGYTNVLKVCRVDANGLGPYRHLVYGGRGVVKHEWRHRLLIEGFSQR